MLKIKIVMPQSSKYASDQSFLWFPMLRKITPVPFLRLLGVESLEAFGDLIL
jgi:hypothetical protein